MVSCGMKGCKNRTDNVHGKKIKFFRFPKKQEFFNKWLEICPVKHSNFQTNGT